MNRPYVTLTQQRRPQRLRDYEYSSPGAYFVTICTHGRKEALTDQTAEIVTVAWLETPQRFPRVKLDTFVVMPNHVHGIIVITDSAQPVTKGSGAGAQRDVGAVHEPPLQDAQTPTCVAQERRRMLVPMAVGFFKTVSAKRINLLRGTPGAPVWQRGYYEHVARGEGELARIRQYIEDNPARWEEDSENPASNAHIRRGGSQTRPYSPSIDPRSGR